MPEILQGTLIGYVVVTYNQASHWPELDYSDIHTDIEDAKNELAWKRDHTTQCGRGERHEIAAVVTREADDG